MTTFYIVRHGQTAANKAGLKQGTINSPQTYLTSLGKEQAANLAAHFDISGFDRIYVSPLVRTQETAKILNERAQLPLSWMSGSWRSLMAHGMARSTLN